MPHYSTLHRSSSQVPSAHSQRSIRRRSGAYQSSVSSPKTSTASRHIVSPDLPRDAQVEQSNSHATATATATASSQSNGSHFTAIPARSRRESIVSSRSGPHRPSLFPATSTLTTKAWIDDGNDGSLSFIAPPPDVRNDPAALPTCNPPTTPLATLSSNSYFSQVTTNIQHLAKHMSSLAHSALSSLRQKRRSFPLPNPRNLSLPISFDSNNIPPSSKNSFGLERGLTPADKLTHKWPRPRSSRSAAPWLRSTNPFLPRSLRELRGAGGWSQGHMEAVLRDSRGLGINWVGQWTFHKWCLLASVTIVFILGLTCLVFSLLTWFAGKSTSPTHTPFFYTVRLSYLLDSTAYPVAPILLITDSPALVLLTFSSSLLLLASMVGTTGTLLNSRPILAVYVLLLFPSFLSFVSVGYLTYKKANFSLDAKVSEAWHHWYSPSARTVLQGALGCCGWSGPLHGAAASGTCYARSPLPGCHGPLVRFERDVLSSVAGTVFSLVPLHLVNIFVGLLCANHVTHRFGKGITPARYRLTAHDILLSAGSSRSTAAVAVDKQGVIMKQLETNLPVPPPLPAPKGHSTFREDRQGVTTYYRHASARAKSEFEREV
jgi:hypothetical protein